MRATVEALAGVLGGCDSLQVGAFDEVIRPPDDFSRRLARNTQLILQKECNLTQVIDPAGGSWMAEEVTADLAGRAWSLFQEVEQLGGMEAALREGFPQKAVEAVAVEKLKAAACRRFPSSASTNTPISRRRRWRFPSWTQSCSTNAAPSRSPPTELRWRIRRAKSCSRN